MRTIAVVNQKGGCGKTTVSINLASALAEIGKRVLLVDMDPQSHCAVGLAVPEEQIEQSIYDVLISKSRNEPIRLTEILWQISDRLELAPASIDLSAFEQQMANVASRECCLRDALDEVKSEYDYTIVDCPPAVGLLTFNALRASTNVVVPVETGYFALHGLSKQLETLSILCKRCSQHVQVNVLASMYDIRTKMGREILAELRAHFGERMLRTVVNFNTKIKEASSFGQPINEYDSSSKGQRDFRSLAEEIIGSDTRLQHRQIVNTLADQLESISSEAEELLKQAKPEVKPRLAVKPQAPQEQAPKAEQIQSIRQPSPGFKESRPAQAGVAISEVEDKTPQKPTFADTNAKLSDYYGVNQIDDAIVFVTLYPRANTVQIAGDFNNWQPARNPMQRVGDSGIWQTELKLPQGKYRYRLVVDGQWQQDPYNERTEVNPFGEYNSVIEVK
jgi:chromosome partitioning protein